MFGGAWPQGLLDQGSQTFSLAGLTMRPGSLQAASPVGALGDHLQVCLWKGTHQDGLRVGHPLRVRQQGVGGRRACPLGVCLCSHLWRACSSFHLPGLPLHSASFAPPALRVQEGRQPRYRFPCQHLSLSLPVCSHPSVSLHFGAVPEPFA